MPLRAFLLGIIGCLIIFGFVYDKVVKSRKTEEELQSAARNASTEQRLYTENYLAEARNQLGREE